MRVFRIRAAIVITSEASLRAPRWQGAFRLYTKNETFAVMTGLLRAPVVAA